MTVCISPLFNSLRSWRRFLSSMFCLLTFSSRSSEVCMWESLKLNDQVVIIFKPLKEVMNAHYMGTILSQLKLEFFWMGLMNVSNWAHADIGCLSICCIKLNQKPLWPQHWRQIIMKSETQILRKSKTNCSVVWEITVSWFISVFCWSSMLNAVNTLFWLCIISFCKLFL